MNEDAPLIKNDDAQGNQDSMERQKKNEENCTAIEGTI